VAIISPFFCLSNFLFCVLSLPKVFFSDHIQTQSPSHTYEGLVRNIISTTCYFLSGD